MEYNFDSLSYRFNVSDTDLWKAYIQDHGFVVVAGVISEEDCKSAIQDIRTIFTKLSPKLSLDDDNSWTRDENYPFTLHGGMVQYIGHAKFQWELREKVAPTFGNLWDVEPTELATSIDGFCYMDGRRGYEPRSIIDTVHCDQAPVRKQLWSYQGVLNLNDCGPKDGGFVVVPDTHKIHQEFFKKINKKTRQSDWYLFKPDDKSDPIFKTAFKVNAKAGDLILFDSRTFHCNTRPTSSNIRACVYICQIPKKRVPEEKKAERKAAWVEKRCSSHHPGDGFRLFKLLPDGADSKIAKLIPELSIKDEDLTELQKSLLCAE